MKPFFRPFISLVKTYRLDSDTFHTAQLACHAGDINPLVRRPIMKPTV